MERFAIQIDKNIRSSLYKICRLCGIDNPNKVPILEEIPNTDIEDRKNGDGEAEMSKKIFDCVGIQVTKIDRMPQCICSLCYDKVNDFYEFREMCLSTNIQTRRLLGLSEMPDLPKIEQSASESVLGLDEERKSSVPPLLNETGNSSSRKRKKSNTSVVNNPPLKQMRTSRSGSMVPIIKKLDKELKIEEKDKNTPKQAKNVKVENQSRKIEKSVKKENEKKATQNKSKRDFEINRRSSQTLKNLKQNIKTEPPLIKKKAMVKVGKSDKESKDTKSSTKSELKDVKSVQDEKNKKKSNVDKLSLAAEKRKLLAKKRAYISPDIRRISLRNKSLPSENTEMDSLPLPEKKICEICENEFKDSESLENHLQSVHVPNIVRYHCIYCNETIINKMDIKNHNLWHKLSKTPYKCGRCDKILETLIGYTKHVHDCSSFEKTDIFTTKGCEKCNNEFETQNLFDWHDCIIDSRICPKCARRLPRKSDVRKHVIRCSGSAKKITKEVQLSDDDVPQILSAQQSLPLPIKEEQDELLIVSEERFPEIDPPADTGDNNSNCYKSNKLAHQNIQQFDNLLKSNFMTMINVKQEPLEENYNSESDIPISEIRNSLEPQVTMSDIRIKEELLNPEYGDVDMTSTEVNNTEMNPVLSKPTIKLKITKELGTLHSSIVVESTTSNSVNNRKKKKKIKKLQKDSQSLECTSGEDCNQNETSLCKSSDEEPLNDFNDFSIFDSLHDGYSSDGSDNLENNLKDVENVTLQEAVGVDEPMPGIVTTIPEITPTICASGPTICERAPGDNCANITTFSEKSTDNLESHNVAPFLVDREDLVQDNNSVEISGNETQVNNNNSSLFIADSVQDNNAVATNGNIETQINESNNSHLITNSVQDNNSIETGGNIETQINDSNNSDFIANSVQDNNSVETSGCAETKINDNNNSPFISNSVKDNNSVETSGNIVTQIHINNTSDCIATKSSTDDHVPIITSVSSGVSVSNIDEMLSNDEPLTYISNDLLLPKTICVGQGSKDSFPPECCVPVIGSVVGGFGYVDGEYNNINTGNVQIREQQQHEAECFVNDRNQTKRNEIDSSKDFFSDQQYLSKIIPQIVDSTIPIIKIKQEIVDEIEIKKECNFFSAPTYEIPCKSNMSYFNKIERENYLCGQLNFDDRVKDEVENEFVLNKFEMSSENDDESADIDTSIDVQNQTKVDFEKNEVCNPPSLIKTENDLNIDCKYQYTENRTTPASSNSDQFSVPLIANVIEGFIKTEDEINNANNEFAFISIKSECEIYPNILNKNIDNNIFYEKVNQNCEIGNNASPEEISEEKSKVGVPLITNVTGGFIKTEPDHDIKDNSLNAVISNKVKSDFTSMNFNITNIRSMASDDQSKNSNSFENETSYTNSEIKREPVFESYCCEAEIKSEPIFESYCSEIEIKREPVYESYCPEVDVNINSSAELVTLPVISDVVEGYTKLEGESDNSVREIKKDIDIDLKNIHNEEGDELNKMFENKFSGFPLSINKFDTEICDIELNAPVEEFAMPLITKVTGGFVKSEGRENYGLEINQNVNLIEGSADLGICGTDNNNEKMKVVDNLGKRINIPSNKETGNQHSLFMNPNDSNALDSSAYNDIEIKLERQIDYDTNIDNEFKRDLEVLQDNLTSELESFTFKRIKLTLPIKSALNSKVERHCDLFEGNTCPEEELTPELQAVSGSLQNNIIIKEEFEDNGIAKNISEETVCENSQIFTNIKSSESCTLEKPLKIEFISALNTGSYMDLENRDSEVSLDIKTKLPLTTAQSSHNINFGDNEVIKQELSDSERINDSFQNNELLKEEFEYYENEDNCDEPSPGLHVRSESKICRSARENLTEILQNNLNNKSNTGNNKFVESGRKLILDIQKEVIPKVEGINDDFESDQVFKEEFTMEAETGSESCDQIVKKEFEYYENAENCEEASSELYMRSESNICSNDNSVEKFKIIRDKFNNEVDISKNKVAESSREPIIDIHNKVTLKVECIKHNFEADLASKEEFTLEEESREDIYQCDQIIKKEFEYYENTENREEASSELFMHSERNFCSNVDSVENMKFIGDKFKNELNTGNNNPIESCRESIVDIQNEVTLKFEGSINDNFEADPASKEELTVEEEAGDDSYRCDQIVEAEFEDYENSDKCEALSELHMHSKSNIYINIDTVENLKICSTISACENFDEIEDKFNNELNTDNNQPIKRSRASIDIQNEVKVEGSINDNFDTDPASKEEFTVQEEADNDSLHCNEIVKGEFEYNENTDLEINSVSIANIQNEVIAKVENISDNLGSHPIIKHELTVGLQAGIDSCLFDQIIKKEFEYGDSSDNLQENSKDSDSALKYDSGKEIDENNSESFVDSNTNNDEPLGIINNEKTEINEDETDAYENGLPINTECKENLTLVTLLENVKDGNDIESFGTSKDLTDDIEIFENTEKFIETPDDDILKGNYFSDIHSNYCVDSEFNEGNMDDTCTSTSNSYQVFRNISDHFKHITSKQEKLSQMHYQDSHMLQSDEFCNTKPSQEDVIDITLNRHKDIERRDDSPPDYSQFISEIKNRTISSNEDTEGKYYFKTTSDNEFYDNIQQQENAKLIPLDLSIKVSVNPNLPEVSKHINADNLHNRSNDKINLLLKQKDKANDSSNKAETNLSTFKVHLENETDFIQAEDIVDTAIDITEQLPILNKLKEENNLLVLHDNDQSIQTSDINIDLEQVHIIQHKSPLRSLHLLNGKTDSLETRNAIENVNDIYIGSNGFENKSEVSGGTSARKNVNIEEMFDINSQNEEYLRYKNWKAWQMVKHKSEVNLNSISGETNSLQSIGVSTVLNIPEVSDVIIAAEEEYNDLCEQFANLYISYEKENNYEIEHNHIINNEVNCDDFTKAEDVNNLGEFSYSATRTELSEVKTNENSKDKYEFEQNTTNVSHVSPKLTKRDQDKFMYNSITQEEDDVIKDHQVNELLKSPSEPDESNTAKAEAAIKILVFEDKELKEVADDSPNICNAPKNVSDSDGIKCERDECKNHNVISQIELMPTVLVLENKEPTDKARSNADESNVRTCSEKCSSTSDNFGGHSLSEISQQAAKSDKSINSEGYLHGTHASISNFPPFCEKTPNIHLDRGNSSSYNPLLGSLTNINEIAENNNNANIEKLKHLLNLEESSSDSSDFVPHNNGREIQHPLEETEKFGSSDFPEETEESSSSQKVEGNNSLEGG